ncbi:MAG: IS200/IS605 family transposase [Acidobacteriota bacterium]
MPRTYARLCFHIVFATKHRTPWIRPELARELYPFVGGVVGDQGGLLLAIGGMPDHVHLLVDLRPHPSVAAVVKAIKGSSSRWINEARRIPDHFAWQEGYAAFSVSTSVLERVRTYVLNQERHHRSSTFQTERRDLLSKHGISFDEAESED